MGTYISIHGLPEKFFTALKDAGFDVKERFLDGEHYYEFDIMVKDTELYLYSEPVKVTKVRKIAEEVRRLVKQIKEG